MEINTTKHSENSYDKTYTLCCLEKGLPPFFLGNTFDFIHYI